MPFVCFALVSTAAHAEIADMFPEMDGWAPEGEPLIYGDDDLFEYIDGAADMYLDYNFREMGTLSYFDDYGRNVIVEIYDHGDLNNAYGMYTREKPRPANLVGVGAEAYYDTGLLNFFRENYYVKIQGFDLADQDEAMLTIVGKIISQKIGGGKDKPPALGCFPAESMVRNTERFIAKNVFGHGFLHSAFVADYRTDGGGNTRGFILVGDDAADAEGMLNSYIALVEENGGTVDDTNGVVRFTDPVSRSAGTMTVKRHGRYVCGLSTADEEAGAAFVNGVVRNLRSAGLLD
jgi:hypothetical protein